MQAISNNQKNHLYEGGDVEVTISGETLDGALVTITEDDIIEGSFSIDRNWSHGSTIEIGCADTSELVFELDNSDGRWSDIRWEGTRLTVVLDIDGEPLQAGIFTVDEPPRKLTTMQIRALDDMAKFNRLYDSTCPYPATLLQILQDACSKCGVTLYTQAFDNDSYLVTERPEGDDITYHHVVAWVAELAGCNAWIDHLARLRLSWYGENQPETPAMEFTRASTAYHPDTGAEVPADTPIYVDFAGGRKGSLMVEGTENLFSTPLFIDADSDGKPDGWSSFGSVYNIREVVETERGMAFHIRRESGSGDYFLSQIKTFEAGKTYTIAIDVFDITNSGARPETGYHMGPWGLSGYDHVAGTHRTNLFTSQKAFIDLGGGWWRVFATFTLDEDSGGSAATGLNTLAVGREFYFIYPQIEQKPYPTSFTDGTRADPTKRITLPEALPQEFGVGVWFKPLHDYDYGEINKTPFCLGNAATRRFQPQLKTDKVFRLAVADTVSGTLIYTLLTDVEFQADDICGVYVHKNGNQVKGYFRENDGTIREGSWVTIAADPVLQYAYIGANYNNLQYFNAVFADFVLHDRPEDIDPEGYLSAIPGGGGE